MRRALAALAALGLSFGAAVGPAQAALPVIDPSNLAQNVLQAAHMVEQINNQLRQLENETRMLAKNPLQLSPDLAASISEAQTLLATAKGLAFDIRRIGAELAELYPETWERFDLASVIAQSDRWMAESRASLETAMAAQARAAGALAGTEARIAAALGSSAAADGQTAAAQAGNQLLGVQASELAEIHALLVAQGRALASERLERLAREARAEEIRRRAFPASRPAEAAPARSAF